MDKEALRAQVKEKKRALNAQQIAQASKRLCDAIAAHPVYRAAHSIYSYLSYNQEVQTRPILEQARKDGKRVAVPKVFGNEMRFLWLDDLDAVAPGYCKIPEPIADGPVADDETALVLLPGLAFDRNGNRCGYGGGFYDRYLQAHPAHPTMAVCFDFQIYDALPTQAHDIPVQYLLSTGIDPQTR